jgi:endonuclease YncB( thermonuclease family)
LVNARLVLGRNGGNVVARIATITRRARFFLICVLIAGTFAAASWFREWRSEVIRGFARVVDGDSLFLRETEIRLFGIDAPELYQTCTRDERPWYCGAEATRALRMMVTGREVACRPRDRDRYARVIAVCHAGELDLGAAMIRSGLAVSYGAYTAEEQEAREARRGLWSSRFDQPAAWRARNPRRER